MKTTTAMVSLFAILYFYNNAYAQQKLKPGYIVKQADTVFGKGYISGNQESCIFKRSDARKSRILLPSEVDAFREIDGRYFVSHQVVESNGKSKWYFLEFLVDGEIDLFAITKSGRFFIYKESEKFIELYDNKKNLTTINGSNYLKKDKRYVGQIKLFMAEAPGLFPEIDKIDNLQQRDLVKLSTQYHKTVCNEYECTTYTKNVPSILYKIELLAGVNYHNSKEYTPQYGLLVHVWRPLRNERLFIKTGILYSARNYERNLWIYTYPKRNTYTFKIPFSFEYIFGKRAFKPLLAIGCPTGIYPIISLQGGFIYSASPRVELSFSGSVDGIMSFIAGMHHEIYNNHFGHSIQAGLIYNFR